MIYVSVQFPNLAARGSLTLTFSHPHTLKNKKHISHVLRVTSYEVTAVLRAIKGRTATEGKDTLIFAISHPLKLLFLLDRSSAPSYQKSKAGFKVLHQTLRNKDTSVWFILVKMVFVLLRK